MLDLYEKFLNEFDQKLGKYFTAHKKYIKCGRGCHQCCDRGEYPMSRIEFSYITRAFTELEHGKKIIVQQKIKRLLEEKKNYKGVRFEHECPFLTEDECCVYKHRGIICRTFGLAYYDEENGYVRLPDCVNNGLNYGEYYNSETGILSIPDVITENLRTDIVLNAAVSKGYCFETGEIRPMLEWLEG